MMSTLRSKAGGWVAKIFIGLLALSFAVWGIADVFRGYRADVLAKVGDVEITAEDYRTAYNRQTRAYSRQLGQTLTPDLVRQLGLDRQILGELIRQAAIKAQARELGLAIPDRAVAQRIAENPAFHNAQGQFNPNEFRQLLAFNGLTEQQFVVAERDTMLRTAIAQAVDNGLTVPQPLLEAFWKYRNELRDVGYVVIRGEESEVPDPSEQQLKEFYDANSSLFTAPERRNFVAITADPAELGGRLGIDEEEIREAYERNRDDYGTPERRVIQQIPFNTEEEARQALERIRGGADFVEIAREKGLTEADATLGELSKSQVPDPKLAEAAFALGEGQVSEPVQGRLSTVLLRVTKVVPGAQKTLEEAREEVVKRLQTERGREEALNIHDKVEDGRAGGQSFEDIANGLGITLLSFEDVDRSGNRPDGTAVAGLPAKDEVLRTVFDTDVGLEADPVQTPEEGFVWVDVREVTPTAVKPFDQVREEVAAAWKQRRLRETMLERARELRKRAEAGASLEELAREGGSEVKSITGLKRGEARDDFDAQAVAALFAAPPDGYAVAPEADGKGAKVMKSSPVMAPPFDAASEDARAVEKSLQAGLGNDLTALYLAGLQSKVGVEVNQELWTRVSTGGT